MKHVHPFSHWLHRKYTMPLLFLVAMCVLVGCGGGSSGTTTTGSTPTATTGSTGATPTTATGASTPTVTTSSVCNLVTTAQASAILGGTVQSHFIGTVTNGPITEHICQYIVPPRGAAATFGVGVATDTTTAQTAFTELQQQQKAKNPSHYQDVSGLG